MGINVSPSDKQKFAVTQKLYTLYVDEGIWIRITFHIDTLNVLQS